MINKAIILISLFGIFSIPNIFSQDIILTTSSTENTNCDGVGCTYNGPSILINEVMMTPSIFDGSIYGLSPSHNPATDCRGEWIELYNPDLCESIDISCYYLGNSAYEGYDVYPGGFVLPEGTVVPPRGFVIVRGEMAPPVPSNLLLANGGNTIEIIVEDINRICFSAGYRLWFPNAGGWFAFYDSNGVPQDAISWADNTTASDPACVPSPGGSCNYNGSLVSYNSIPNDRKRYISTASPTTDMTFSRIPDGGDWTINSPTNPTYGTCNTNCVDPADITCNGTATVNASGGNSPYTFIWDDPQHQQTFTADGLCAGIYCVTVTDNTNNSATACIEVIQNSIIANITTSPLETCEGNDILLTANYGEGQSPYSLTWTGPNNFTSNQANPVISNCQTNNTGTYNLTVTDNYGCSIIDQTEIIINENPEALAGNSGPICIGSDLLLSVQSFNTYTWSGPDGFTNFSQNPTISTFTEDNAGLYQVTVSDNNGCTTASETIVETLPGPYITISAETVFCEGEDINLSCSPADLYNYSWSGPLSFISSNQNTTIYSSSPEQTGTYTVTAENYEGCIGTANISLDIYPLVNATITPIPPLCFNDPNYTLTASTIGGTWSGNGVSDNNFNPSDADCGTHEINYTISNEACTDNDQTTIDVYENISIINFSDNICDGTYTEYYVSFEVVNQSNNSTIFLMDIGTGFNSYSGPVTLTYPSLTPYSITVTDAENQCDTYILNGVRDCGCFTSAGNMSSLQTVSLCYGDCSDMVTHSSNESLDSDDTFGFILHDGSFPLDVLASGLTPEFCFHLIPGLILGDVYYISAVAGNEISSGIPDYNDPCISISQGTPVIWYKIPIAHIDTEGFVICGLEAEITADSPTSGMTGIWSSTLAFWPNNETSQSSPDISLVVDSYGIHTFYWNINNAGCIGTDEINIEFIQTPSAYAGDNFSVCGNTAVLDATFSHPTSTGQWTGPGQFSNSESEDTEVSVSLPGQYTFTWRETNGDCWDEDQVIVNFIPTPNPIILQTADTICGNIYDLSVTNVQGEGLWSAYNNGEMITPAPNYTQGINNPNTQVIIPNYAGGHLSVEFIWSETTTNAGVECIATATATIVFARIPVASVGASNETEVCGNSTQLNANITGSEYAEHTWISNQISAEFDDPTLPDANITIIPLGAYGDSAYVRIPVIWAVQNYGCTSIDTMWLTFYEQPDANAGLDNQICGRDYELGAVYDFTESANYTPSGTWSVYEKPIPSSTANIIPLTNDTVDVTVSYHGEWVFQFRENNTNLPSCHSTDTVRIEFIEIPIISAGEDQDVCGNETLLSGTDGGFNGTWLPNSTAIENYADPNTEVYSPIYGPIEYIWLESNVICSAKDTVVITFWREPEATILTDLEDSATCGLTFCNLRAESPGSEITGYWFTQNSATDFDDEFDIFTCATVPSYGSYDFYWIEETGPQLESGFCTDTAGPLTIYFIETPEANAGSDTTICGYSGNLDAIPSYGTGIWSTPSVENISFEDSNDPNTLITTILLGEYTISWTEDNTNGCTDFDDLIITFAKIPESNLNIIPPKCFGEPATIAASEDSLQQYSWNFFSGTIDSTTMNLMGGEYQNFVYWNSEDTLHRISLIATNSWGCQSPITIDTLYEPAIPDFDVTLISDTCMLNRGGIIFGDTLDNTSFFWIDATVGPPVGPITTVYDLPSGEYYIRTSYLTPNTTHYAYYLSTFNSANCVDTLLYEIEPIGMIEALIEIDITTDMGELVAPEATVYFNNNSIYDDVSKRCEWHFGDETTEKNCDSQVEHIYTEAGCYEPFLIVMNRDLPECRDTAYIDACIPVDNASGIEIPNIFSPNGDGINDFFQVKAETLRTFSGIIVNRWGRTVYEWDNWSEYEAGWDGRLNGTTEATTGVYYYIIKAVGIDDIEYDFHGSLHLMRD